MPQTDGKLTPLHHAKTLAGRKFFLLFLFLLASLMFYPYAESNAFSYYAFRVIGSAIIVLCVYAVSFSRSLLVVAIVLAIPVFLHRLVSVNVSSSALSILNISLSFSFDVFIAIVIFRRVFAPNQPNSETIFGALSIYLLVGFAFASIYGVLAAIQTRASYLDPVATFTPFPTGSIASTTASRPCRLSAPPASFPSPEKRAAYRRSKRLSACSTSRFSFPG